MGRHRYVLRGLTKLGRSFYIHEILDTRNTVWEMKRRRGERDVKNMLAGPAEQGRQAQHA